MWVPCLGKDADWSNPNPAEGLEAGQLLMSVCRSGEELVSLEATIQAEDCSHPEQLRPESPATQPAPPVEPAAQLADGALAPQSEEEALMIQRLVPEERLKSNCRH